MYFGDCLKHCTLPKPLNFSNLRSCYVTLNGFSLFFNQNFLYPDFVLAENHLTLLLFSSHLTVFMTVERSRGLVYAAMISILNGGPEHLIRGTLFLDRSFDCVIYGLNG